MSGMRRSGSSKARRGTTRVCSVGQPSMTLWRVHRFLPLRSLLMICVPSHARGFAMPVSSMRIVAARPGRSAPCLSTIVFRRGPAPPVRNPEIGRCGALRRSRLPAWGAPRNTWGAPRNTPDRARRRPRVPRERGVRVQADGRLPCDGLSDGCVYARGVTVFRAAVRARATERTHTQAAITRQPRGNHVAITQ
jgi:hypothetical protein